MKEMKRNRNSSVLKAVVALAVALAFILPGSAVVANIGTIGVTSNSGNLGDINPQIESVITDSTEKREITIEAEKPGVDTEYKETDLEPPEVDITGAAVETDTVIDPASWLLDRAIIYVDDDNTAGPWDGSWEHPYQYIQHGINNAADGDTIYVLNGVYNEKLTVNKKVNLIGQHRQNTIIDGGTSYGDTITIIVDYVNISTFTVKKAYTYGSKTITVGTSASKVSNIIIINCDISNVGATKGTGIYVYYPQGPIDIINCKIYNTQYGIDVLTPANPTRIIDCSGHTTGMVIRLSGYYYSVAPFLIQNCTTYNSTYGIYIDSMIDGDIIGCTSYNNSYYGISLHNSDYVNITDCITYNNTRDGIKIGSGYNNPENVNITNCTSYNNEKGIYLYALNCILTGNTMYDNTHNFVVEVLLNHQVDPTNTVNGKPIWYLTEVENLTLNESYNIGFLGLISCNNITVKNATPEGIVLSLTTNTTLYNITIHGRLYGVYASGGSNITFENCIASNITNTGFYIYYVDNVTLINCHVPNFVAYNKNAFYIRGCSYATLINCTASDIARNYGFNIYQCPYATLLNCHASNGGPTFATGIALYYSPYTTLTNCTVHHFQRGIDLRSNSQFVTLTDCTVYNITYCGFEARSSDCTFINCTVYNSEGFYFYNQPRNNLTNCKSYNNRGSGFYFYYSTDNNLVNCESYNNSAHGIDIHSSSYSNTFTNCKSYNNGDHGIIIKDNSYGTALTDCQIYNNKYGMYITNSPNNVITNTSIFSNTYNFDVIGAAITDFYQDIDTSNTINGKTMYYLVEKANMTLDETSNVGFLRLLASDNITVKNVDLSTLMVIRTTNSTLSNIISHDGTNGIHLWESPNNAIIGCTVYNNTGHGVYLQTSPGNTLTNGTISNNNGHGVYLLNSPDTEMTNWTVTNNNYGIYISASANSLLRDNSFSGNTHGFGIEGTAITHFYQDVDPTNKINEKPIYYFIDDSDKTIDETHNFGYLILVSCDNMTLKNLDVNDLMIILTTNSTLSNITSHDGKNGIYLWDSPHNTLLGCTIYNNNGYGIYLQNSPNNVIMGASLLNNNHGIYLTDSSSYTTLQDCTVHKTTKSGYGIYLGGSSYNTIEDCHSSNHAQGFYLVNSFNNNLLECTAHGNTYGIQLSGSTWNTILNSDFYGNSNDGLYFMGGSNNNNILGCRAYNNNRYGMYLYQAANIVVENCHIYSNTQYGLYGYQLTNSNIKGTTIHGSARGIYLYISTTGNTITDCNIHGNSYGIYLYLTTTVNTIMNSDVHGNQYGVYFSGSSCQNNVVVNCSVYNNNEGIYSTSSAKYNKMYHNTLAGNGRNAYSSVTTNIWDNGYPSGGNYWSDYTGEDLYSGPGQNVTGSDGIGDTPYQVGNVKDNYPLMTPKVVPPPVITNIAASPDPQSTTEPVNITCTVTDYTVQIHTVKVYITGPEGFSLNTTMSANGSSYWYARTYTTMGVYYYYIWANNTFGRESISDTKLFVISDVDTPTSSVNPLPAWVKTLSFTVTATAYDNTGVANVTLWYRYSTDNTNWTTWTSYGTDTTPPWSWSFTGIGDGYYEFYSIAVDDYGNIEAPPATADASTGIDTVKPVTTINHTGPMGENEWYIGVVNVTLSATDTLSGIESTWYRIDTGSWKLYTGVFPVTGEGTHTIAYYSFDKAGNKEDTKTASFKIDTKPPITTHQFDGLLVSGVYVSDVIVTLSATDGATTGLILFEQIRERFGLLTGPSGVNYTMYKINDGNWTLYEDSFTITDDGTYTISYYSVDNAGNTETIRDATFTLEKDLIPPVTTHTFSGVLGDNNWYISDVTVALTATDNAAGVQTTMYKLNDGDWTEYKNPFVVTEDGVHTLVYYSVDKLGNTEANNSATFKIDKTAPVIVLMVEKTGLKWLLTAAVTDDTSGIARVEFYLNGEYLGEDTEAPYTWEVTKKGTAQAIVYDNAGNSAISDEVPVSVNLNLEGQHTSSQTQITSSLLQWFLLGKEQPT
jgi:parallel beta-helix repeat protein